MTTNQYPIKLKDMFGQGDKISFPLAFVVAIGLLVTIPVWMIVGIGYIIREAWVYSVKYALERKP